MRKTLQRRPGFEALESITLLSGLAGPAVTIAAPNPIHLTGSIKIQTTPKAIISELKHNSPYPAEKESGSISPLGHVKGSGVGLSLISLLFADSGSLTLNAKTGKVFVSISGVTDAGNGYAGEYTITGGTNAYAGAIGSGNILITYPFRGKFNAIFS
jgi:hypothetical protein